MTLQGTTVIPLAALATLPEHRRAALTGRLVKRPLTASAGIGRVVTAHVGDVAAGTGCTLMFCYDVAARYARNASQGLEFTRRWAYTSRVLVSQAVRFAHPVPLRVESRTYRSGMRRSGLQAIKCAKCWVVRSSFHTIYVAIIVLYI